MAIPTLSFASITILSQTSSFQVASTKLFVYGTLQEVYLTHRIDGDRTYTSGLQGSQ
jgi:hypothetical protein